MKIFNPSTGGHPAKNDDLVLVQTAFKEAIKGFFSFANTSDKLILSGCVVNDNGTTISCTPGYIFFQDEIYQVSSTSFPKQVGSVLFFKIISTVLSPSPVTYADQTVKSVHFNRTMQLDYFNSSFTGDYFTNFTRINAQGVRIGTIIEWYGDINSNFDTTGLGINNMASYAICNGLYGTPDLRGLFTVMATNLPSSGAPALNPAIGTYNISQTGGEAAVSLTAIQNGPHTHNVTDPGHVHNARGANANWNSGSPDGKLIDPGNKSGLAVTQSSITGISIDSSGSGAPHENRPPFFAVVKLMCIN